jgi:hypothetical protein
LQIALLGRIKKDDSFSPRSRALGHMTIMYNGQHSPDAKIEKPHRCQESRQFTVSGKVKYIQRHSYCQQEKACEYPGRSGLSSHPAATPHTKTRLSSENTRFKGGKALLRETLKALSDARGRTST